MATERKIDESQALAKVLNEALPAVPGQALNRQTDYLTLMALAKELITTGFLPQVIKTPAQAVAIILTGQELGLPPMKSLRLINVIQGKPCLAAELQLALFKQRGGRAQWIESTEDLATIKLTHPNGDMHTETFCLQDAERAGLLKKGGNWTTYPKIMLRWRAASNGLKAIAPDILSGIYDPDEMGAIVDIQTGEIVQMPPPEAKPIAMPTPVGEEPQVQDTRVEAPSLMRLPITWTKGKDSKGKSIPHPHAGRALIDVPTDALAHIMEGLRADPTVPGQPKEAKYQALLDAIETEFDGRLRLEAP